MSVRRLFGHVAMLGAAAMLAGCQQPAAEVANPLPIAAAEYDRVFDASVRALRSMDFDVDRQDRRFGVVTTHPTGASSLFEPWRDDNTGSDQVMESTLNDQRRVARVLLKPAGAAEETVEASPPAEGPAEYQLAVEVTVERRHVPSRPLHTAAVSTGEIRGRRAGRVRSILTEEGTLESAWWPVGRDEQMERRLIAAIMEHAVQPSPAEGQGP